MKRSTKIIAAVAAVVLLLTFVPAVFSLVSVNTKKTAEYPLPMSVDRASYLTLKYWENGELTRVPLYLSESLMSQRIQQRYGAEEANDVGVDSRTLDFTIDADTMTAYGLNEESAQYYINGMKYAGDNHILFNYGDTEAGDTMTIGALVDVSAYFENAVGIYPKEGEENHFFRVSNDSDDRIQARIQDNPIFRFFFTNGPAVVGTDYDPSTGTLFDKAFTEGMLEEDLVFTFKTEVEDADLIADLPEKLTLKDLSTGESKELVAGSDWSAPAEGSDVNEVPVTLKAEFLNTLEKGEYQINLPFANGTSVIFLKVDEAPCKGDENCPSSAFTDLDPTQWYHNAADFAIESGMMVGDGNGKFMPTGETTRAMIATILWNGDRTPEPAENSGFADVAEGAWYAKAVAWAKEEGYVSGYNATTFGPNDPITREQLALILHNYVKENNGNISVIDPDVLDVFTDAAETSDWAVEAMKWACDYKIFSGKGNGKLDPKGTASRAEVAQVMMQFAKSIAAED